MELNLKKWVAGSIVDQDKHYTRASDEANNVLYTCCDIRRDLIRSYLQDAKQTQLSATITHWDYNAIDPVRHKYFSLVRIYLIGKTA